MAVRSRSSCACKLFVCRLRPPVVHSDLLCWQSAVLACSWRAAQLCRWLWSLPCLAAAHLTHLPRCSSKAAGIDLDPQSGCNLTLLTATSSLHAPLFLSSSPLRRSSEALGINLDPQFVRDLTILIAASAVAGVLMGCLGQPAINGYFLAGSLVGPGGLQLLHELVPVGGGGMCGSSVSSVGGILGFWGRLCEGGTVWACQGRLCERTARRTATWQHGTRWSAATQAALLAVPVAAPSRSSHVP